MKHLASYLFLTLILTISAFAQTSIKVGSPAPLFVGNSLDGTSYDLNELRGSVVVMTFWSTRCAICHSEIPKLNTFTSKFDPKKVVFLALSMENEEKIAGYLQSNRFNFQILPNSFGVVLQYADRDKAGNLGMGFPSFFVIDQQGTVRYKTSGYDKTPQLSSQISKLLSSE